MGNPKVVPREEAVSAAQAGKRGLLVPLGSWSALGNSPSVRCWTAGWRQMGLWHGKFGANTNVTSCLEKESRGCSRELTGELWTLTNPTCILCLTQRRWHAAVKEGWARSSEPRASCSTSLLHGVHWPLKLPKMWCSFSSVVLMREGVKGSFQISSSMTLPQFPLRNRTDRMCIYGSCCVTGNWCLWRLATPIWAGWVGR